MGGEAVRMVQMRNPWEGPDGWNGDYSVTQGGAKYEDLKAALEVAQGGIKIEDGKFWMSFNDFTKEYSGMEVGHSQETRTLGGEERAEYRPRVELDESSIKHFLRVTLYDEVNLNNDVFVIDNIQGGNRLGTARNPDFNKIDSGMIRYNILPKSTNYTGNEFRHRWYAYMNGK